MILLLLLLLMIIIIIDLRPRAGQQGCVSVRQECSGTHDIFSNFEHHVFFGPTWGHSSTAPSSHPRLLVYESLTGTRALVALLRALVPATRARLRKPSRSARLDAESGVRRRLRKPFLKWEYRNI